MSKLQELINKLCPDGVEHIILKKICNIYDGTHQTPKYTDSGVKFVSVENINALYDTQKYISVEDFDKYKIKPQKNDVLMTRIGTIGICAVVDSNEPLAYYVSLALLRPDLTKINSKYLKYVIESKYGRKELRKRTLVNAVPIKVNMGDIGKITIPVPPLEVQGEIVRILDNFTELTAELTADLETELETRKKQYNHYKNTFFAEYNKTKYKLKDVADIYLGLTYTPRYVDNGIKFISSQNISKDYLDLENNIKYISKEEFENCTNNAKPKKGDVLFTRVGSNLGHPTVVDTDEPLCIFVSLGYLRAKEEYVLGSYLKHWMNSEAFWDQVKKKTKNIPKVNLNSSWMREFDISIPNIEKQRHIVTILDQYDKLRKDLFDELTAEIATQQKQYEYYRDKLLTFKGL